MGGLRTRLIGSPDEWDRIGAQWDALVGAVEEATAFQRFHFLRTWWRHFGRDKSLHVIVAERNGELHGALPLQIARRRKLGRHYRVLEFIGMPDELDRPRLLVPGEDAAVWSALLGALSQHGALWDLVQLEELDSDSPQVARLESWADAERLWHRTDPLHPVPFLRKDGDFEGYCAQRSKRLRKALRHARNRAERAHGIRYREARDPAAVRELIDVFFRIEKSSWKAEAERDVGRVDAYPAFYRELLAGGGAGFRPHAFVQYLGGEPSAATLGFSEGGRHYALQIAHDGRFDHCSPGTLLEHYEMERFFADADVDRYEFLGGAGFNKRRWTDTAVATCTFRAWRPGPWVALATTAKYRVLPRLQRLVGRRPDASDRPEHPAPFRPG